MKGWIFTTIIVGSISVAAVGIGVGTYFIIDSQNKNNDSNNNVAIFENPEVSDNLKQFSQNNSFRVCLQAGISSNNGTPISQGTAWSWYYATKNNKFEWYLMTNFHVIADSVVYKSDYDENGNLILKNSTIVYDATNNLTNFAFSLQNWKVGQKDQNIGSYGTLVSTYSSSTITNNAWQKGLEQVELINDNDIDGFDLFSNDTSSSSHYNLDMGLIKLIFKSEPDFITNMNISNAFGEYCKFKNIQNIMANINNQYIYIAGNPGSKKQLIYQLVNQNEFNILSINNVYTTESNNQIVNMLLNKLYEPAVFYNGFVKDWPLSQGASGSAVYLTTMDNDKISTFMYNFPIGIFWGGYQATNIENAFQPSYIPLIISNEINFKNYNYNIYENFLTLYNQGKI